MMFSTKAEYGVRVMVELARRAGEDPIPLAEIASHDGLPLAYLEHLVARLRKAGLVDSRRGSRGGYLLARSPTEITMAEVVEALEGSIAPIARVRSFPCLPDEAPVDARALCDRAHAPGDHARRARARTRTFKSRTRIPAGEDPQDPHILEIH
jgi:Rrf2 family protein